MIHSGRFLTYCKSIASLACVFFIIVSLNLYSYSKENDVSHSDYAQRPVPKFNFLSERQNRKTESISLPVTSIQLKEESIKRTVNGNTLSSINPQSSTM